MRKNGLDDWLRTQASVGKERILPRVTLTRDQPFGPYSSVVSGARRVFGEDDARLHRSPTTV